MTFPQKTASSQKVIPITAMDEGKGKFFTARVRIHPRTIQGLFARWRWVFVFLTQILFYGLPWLQWGHRQAVLFDLGARRFYIFGLVFYPQDLIYLTGLLVISALSLFLFTAVAGRLWCGYTCPQTVYSEIFMWIEHRIEGDRSARIRLDRSGMTLEKVAKRTAKHFVWIVLAFWTGFTFVGFFSPIRELGASLVHGTIGAWGIFWICFYGFATYGNAGFMREQVCKYMCPYARFQGAMFDRDTLIVSYDEKRGEPRGPRIKSQAKSQAAHKANELGDCIDCSLCVQVCPMGIDIRSGLQYECIGCGLCVDACDSVMDKFGYSRGLVRYATQNGMAKNWSNKQILRHVFRPRVLIYGTILLLLTVGLFTSLVLRVPLKVDVVRDRASLARIAEGGMLENVYRLQLMNATEAEQEYSIQARGLNGLKVLPGESIVVEPAQSRWVVLRLQVPYGSASAGSHKVYFDVKSANGQSAVSEKATFIVPR